VKIYFIRHGHTDANETSIPDPLTGEIDLPLNAVGIQQAQDAAEELKDVDFDAIVSSTLNRAYQTAEIVNQHHGLPIEILPEWREREVGGHVDYEVWKTYFNFDTNISPEKGETLSELFTRVYEAIEELKVEFKGKTILLAAHGGVHTAVYAYANKLPLAGEMRVLPLKNCEYRVYDL
jgi:uncharacterized phosphatase